MRDKRFTVLSVHSHFSSFHIIRINELGGYMTSTTTRRAKHLPYSTYTGWGGKGGSGCKTGAGACALRSSGSGPCTVIVKVVDDCGRGGADREPRRNVLIMSK